MTVGILSHPMIPASRPLAQTIADWVAERGHAVWVGSVWERTPLERKVGDLSLLIVLGGDGSILRAARAAAEWGVPLFSVNMGQLGFLSEATPDDWAVRLTRALAGDYRLERRLMLHATIARGSVPIGQLTALNEIVVSRGGQARVVRFRLHVDGEYVMSYVADGLITATPTGSTAYALAAGGPVMPPELPNMLIVPVAPHLSFDRALVLYENAEVMMEVRFDHEANVTADGQDAITLQSGDTVTIRKARNDSLFARTDEPSYFYRRLMARSGSLRHD